MIDLLSLQPLAPGRLSAEVPATMAQGRSAFGGFVVALAVRAAEGLVAPGRGLRSVAVQFVGPVSAGALSLEARVLREGRALSQVEVRVSQEGEERIVVLLALGAARPTRLTWPAAAAPALPPVEALPLLPYLEGVTPTFTQHFEYRWARGGLPFTRSPEPGFVGLIRPKVGGVDLAVLTALLDAWPAPVLPMADRVVPASTVNWLVNVVGPLDGAAADAWWTCAVDAVASGEGYVDVDTRLWGPDGALVATSRQLAVEFSG